MFSFASLFYFIPPVPRKVNASLTYASPYLIPVQRRSGFPFIFLSGWLFWSPSSVELWALKLLGFLFYKLFRRFGKLLILGSAAGTIFGARFLVVSSCFNYLGSDIELVDVGQYSKRLYIIHRKIRQLQFLLAATSHPPSVHVVSLRQGISSFLLNPIYQYNMKTVIALKTVQKANEPSTNRYFSDTPKKSPLIDRPCLTQVVPNRLRLRVSPLI